VEGGDVLLVAIREDLVDTLVEMAVREVLRDGTS
jgi:hypothetical protein